MQKEQTAGFGAYSDIRVRGRAVTMLHYGERKFEGSGEQNMLSELLSEVYRRTYGKKGSVKGEKKDALRRVSEPNS